MRRMWTVSLLAALMLLVFSAPSLVRAQGETPPANAPDLSLTTDFPSQVIGIGESATLQLRLHAEKTAQTVQLSMDKIPDGWTATFRGDGQVIQSAYASPAKDLQIDLRLDPPADVKPGAYDFIVLAQGDQFKAELPLHMTIKEKLPPRLSLSADLPTIIGSPSTTFRYNVNLRNEGDQDLTVSLAADAPSSFQVTFKLLGQDVTSLPLGANQSKQLSVEAQPVGTVQAGDYPITVHAQGEDAEASLDLTAQVTGQAQLNVTAPDGRLSGNAYVGRNSTFKITVQNTGTAPVRGIVMSSTEPSGWKVDFQPKQIAEIPAGQQVDVTATLRPADNAVAGDYMVTVQAQPADGTSKSADFRITVLTSTLWGVAGIGLIAVSLGVVALAVVRFGRR